VEFHEIKGRTARKRSDGTRVDAPWSREVAKLKIRIAAAQFDEFAFPIVFRLEAGDGSTSARMPPGKTRLPSGT
jgi:hypothetical protein